MSSLYELTTEFQTLMAMMEDQDVDPEVLADTMEAVSGEIEVKAQGYAYVIRNAEADLKAITDEYNFFKVKKDHLENNVKRLKEAVKNALVLTGHDDKAGLKAGEFTLKVAGNGGKRPLVITGDVPENMTKITIAPDNERIRAFLEGLDAEDTCDWAHLEDRGTHLTIK